MYRILPARFTPLGASSADTLVTITECPPKTEHVLGVKTVQSTAAYEEKPEVCGECPVLHTAGL